MTSLIIHFFYCNFCFENTALYTRKTTQTIYFHNSQRIALCPRQTQTSNCPFWSDFRFHYHATTHWKVEMKMNKRPKSMMIALCSPTHLDSHLFPQWISRTKPIVKKMLTQRLNKAAKQLFTEVSNTTSVSVTFLSLNLHKETTTGILFISYKKTMTKLIFVFPIFWERTK